MRPASFLDRPAARFVAAGIFLLCLAALGYIHRDDVFPAATQNPGAKSDPFALCFVESARKIDKMVADGLIGDDRAQRFRSRAEARCRAQTKKASGLRGGGPTPGAPSRPAR